MLMLCFLVPLYCSFSYYPLLLLCLVPFTLLYHITPASALLSLWVPCCWYFFPFTFLYLVTPAAALVFSPLVFFLFLYSLLLCLVPHYSSFSYYPCCFSVFLFPFTFLSLHIPCCSTLFPFTLVSFNNPC